MKVAGSGVGEACSCSGFGLAHSEAFAVGDDARDGTSTVETVCGSGDLPGCPPPAEDLTACLGAPPVDTDYVEVHTLTRMPDGQTLLPPVFAQTLLGQEGYAGSQVRACARAAWGPPQRASGLAVTVSLCEWNDATMDGTDFAPPPPATPSTSDEVVVYLHTTSPKHCTTRPSGGDAPGGFGWLDDPDDQCSVTVEADGTYGGDPGASASQACKNLLPQVRADRTITYLPIYHTVAGTGQHTTYTLEGFAAFVITGYALPGLSDASSLTGTKYCKGSDKCLYGYFTQALIPTRGTIGGTDLGAEITTLIG